MKHNPALTAAIIAATINSRKRKADIPDWPHTQYECNPFFVLFIVFLLGCVAFLGSLLTGCATTEKLAEGIAVKNISGNGTFAKNSIGLNPETKIPEISSTFVSGDYSSAKAGTNSILYRSESSGSLWNAKVLTKKQFVSITLVDTGDVGDVIRAVSEVLRAAQSPEQETTEENP